jgi:hypothetical protein
MKIYSESKVNICRQSFLSAMDALSLRVVTTRTAVETGQRFVWCNGIENYSQIILCVRERKYCALQNVNSLPCKNKKCLLKTN